MRLDVPAKPGTKPRILELDGVRGVAILLVIIGHYCSFILPGVEFFSVASLGVNVFFVLSGYLIGGIILDEHREPGFLRSFYMRRAARILPIYFSVVAAAFFIAWLTADKGWTEPLLPAWVYLLFLTNIALAWFGHTSLLLNPTWSLAVEEQFYLAMPFVMMATPHRRLPVVLLSLAALAVVLRAFASPAAAEVLLPCRMDSLLIGVGAALLQRSVDLSRRAIALTAAAFVPLLINLLLGKFARPAGVVFEPTGHALTTAMVMLAAINGGVIGAPLRAAWLRWVGEISYGLYLIHEPIRILLTGWILGRASFALGLDRAPVNLLALAVALAIAHLSWRYFERPIILRVRRTLASRYSNLPHRSRTDAARGG
jgi:peptidoglycan/LPS O-acetylase OafA/YrhL